MQLNLSTGDANLFEECVYHFFKELRGLVASFACFLPPLLYEGLLQPRYEGGEGKERWNLV